LQSPAPNPQARQAPAKPGNKPQTHPENPQGHEHPVRVRSKTCLGPCRTSGMCARLRTIMRANATIELFTILVRSGQISFSISSATAGRRKKAREDRLPHERGLLPVPPSEFCCNALADPKARFCRSPASHSSTRQRNPRLPPRQTADPEALNYCAVPAARTLGPAQANGPLPANPLISRRACQTRLIP
jgi:hypothetical protein